MLVSHFQDLFIIGHRILASGFFRCSKGGWGRESGPPHWPHVKERAGRFCILSVLALT